MGESGAEPQSAGWVTELSSLKSGSWGLLSGPLPSSWMGTLASTHLERSYTQQETWISCVLFSASYFSCPSGNQLSSISSSQSYQTMVGRGGRKRLMLHRVKSPHQLHLVPSLEFSLPLNLWFLVACHFPASAILYISSLYFIILVCFCGTINPAIVMKLLAWLRFRMMVKVKEPLTAAPQICNPRQCSPKCKFYEAELPCSPSQHDTTFKRNTSNNQKELKSNWDFYYGLWKTLKGFTFLAQSKTS